MRWPDPPFVVQIFGSELLRSEQFAGSPDDTIAYGKLILDSIAGRVLVITDRAGVELYRLNRTNLASPPKMLRTGSTRHAAELARLGWTVEYQFFWGEDTEPYEIGLRWDGDGDPVLAGQSTDNWLTPEGIYLLNGEREMRHQHTWR